MGKQTITSLPVPETLSWFKVLRTEGLALEAGFQYSQPAYDPRSKRVWAGSSEGSLHCLTSDDGHVVWTRDINGVRSPIVRRNGVLFLGAGDGRLMALDEKTGAELWSYKVRGVVMKAPIVTEKFVLITDGTNAIYAVDRATGKWAWQYRRDPPRHFAVFGESRPLVHRGTVYLGFSDGYLVALNERDGATLWTKDLAPSQPKFPDVDADPIIMDGVLYGASLGGGLYALDPKTGDTQWVMPTMGISGLLRHQGDLVATLDTGAILRIDPFRRKSRWSTRLPMKRGYAAPLTVAGRHVLVPMSGGAMIWLDIATGQPIRAFNSGPGFSAAPAFAEGDFYAFDNASTLFAFRAVAPRVDTRSTPLTDP
jgi:outer membrane protein assembly factor BamB